MFLITQYRKNMMWVRVCSLHTGGKTLAQCANITCKMCKSLWIMNKWALAVQNYLWNIWSIFQINFSSNMFDFHVIWSYLKRAFKTVNTVAFKIWIFWIHYHVSIFENPFRVLDILKKNISILFTIKRQILNIYILVIYNNIFTPTFASLNKISFFIDHYRLFKFVM